jgi:hypothetical protein
MSNADHRREEQRFIQLPVDRGPDGRWFVDVIKAAHAKGVRLGVGLSVERSPTNVPTVIHIILTNNVEAFLVPEASAGERKKVLDETSTKPQPVTGVSDRRTTAINTPNLGTAHIGPPF